MASYNELQFDMEILLENIGGHNNSNVGKFLFISFSLSYKMSSFPFEKYHKISMNVFSPVQYAN
jgi:hypothetical protein